MVMSGEGADEMFGGYLYFHKAPNAVEFHEENVAKLLDLCANPLIPTHLCHAVH